MAHFDEFAQGETLAIDALLDCQPDEQLANVLAWPNDPRAFHYHTLVPAMRASGSFKVGHRVHGFSPTRSFGLFSWNRGVWPLETEHVWGIAQGWQDGTGGAAFGSHTVALQMVAGLDERAATQNAFFLDGRVIKLGHVDIQVPPGQDPAGKTLAERFDLLGSWRITDDAVAVDLTFAPANDAADSLNAYAVFLDRHQVFGTFSGTVQIEGHPFVLAGLFGVMAVEHAKL